MKAFPETLPFFAGQLVRLRNGRQAGRVKNFVGVRISDSAHVARIGERALQRVVVGTQRRAELREIA